MGGNASARRSASADCGPPSPRDHVKAQLRANELYYKDAWKAISYQLKFATIREPKGDLQYRNTSIGRGAR